MPRKYYPVKNPRCPCNGKSMTPQHLESKVHKDYERISKIITESFQRFCEREAFEQSEGKSV